MILTCERCETRFRLDESRLPATGARVRCSRCKHAFFVQPPGAPAADAIQELAEQAAVTGRPAPPEPSWDLEDAAAAAGRTMQRGARPAAQTDAAGDFESESDWRFEDEVPQLGDSGASLDLPNGEASGTPSLDANESSFAELGDPESWDLLASSSGGVTATRAAAPVPVEAPPATAVAATPVSPVATPIRTPVVSDDEDPETLRAPLPLPLLDVSPGMRLGGWIATATLVAGVALLGLLPTASPPQGRLDTVSVGPLAVTALAPRLVDHALAGPIWVVSGELHNPGTEARALGATVGVTLLDATGAPIEGAVATAAPPFPAASLREFDPDRLRAEVDAAAAALAARPIAPGDHVAIEAVFASAPRGAVRFALAPQPVRARPIAVEPPPSVEPAPQPLPATEPSASPAPLDPPAPS